MDDARARAFWVTGAGAGAIRGESLPPPPAGWVRVRTLFSGISRGTECLVFRGEVPPGEFERMRAPFQDGDFPAPVKYGYCNVGRVEAGPAALRDRLVFCLYPHQTRYQVPAAAVHPLPERVPPARALLAANLETAINGLWDAAPRIGDRIAVIGAGTLGCLVAYLAARLPGCDLELIDTLPERATIAAALGARFATARTATPDADVVIHASGAPAGLDLALDLAGYEALVLELSWFGSQRVALALGAGFHRRRLTLRSSQVGGIATAQRARWTHARRLALALRLLDDAALDSLLTDHIAFDALPETMARLAAGSSAPLMTVVHYGCGPAAH